MLPTLLRSALCLTAVAPAFAGDGDNERVSVDSAEDQALGDSYRPAVSRTGRHVAFFSLADDLVAGDTNDNWDVFVRDRHKGTTVRVSVSSAGVQGNRDCFVETSTSRGVALSETGRWVAFHSRAYNLVPVDTNSSWDCFVHDRDPDGNGIFDEGNGTTEMVSVDSSGNQYASYPSQAPWISADGRFVSFESMGRLAPNDTNAKFDVYVRDRKLGITRLISMEPTGGAGDDDSQNAMISGSGAYVAYESLASNLVLADGNGVRDVFLTEVVSGFTRRVSVGPGGLEADGSSRTPALSASGFQVVFSSAASNLHPNDTNVFEDIFLHDITTGVTLPVSVRPGGQTADDLSLHPSISPNGRYVGFESLATDMTPMDSFHFRDIFVLDRKLDTMTWISRARVGDLVYPHTDGRNRWPAVNSNGRVIAFESESRNLVKSDTNDAWDVFVRRRNPAWRPPWI